MFAWIFKMERKNLSWKKCEIANSKKKIKSRVGRNVKKHFPLSSLLLLWWGIS